MTQQTVTIKPNWHTQAHRLFGFSLGCSNNHDAVARALGEIADILAEHGDIEITVRRIDGAQNPPTTTTQDDKG